MVEICIKEINENIRRVYAGEELTKPLRELNKSCEFRKEYDKFCLIQEGVPSDYKAYRKAYQQRPEVKAHMKAYEKAYRKRRKEIRKRRKEIENERLAD